MKPELTPQILWLYIGQPCHIENPSLVFSNDHNGVITPDNVIGHMNRERVIVPHLRRLENITEEECREVYNIETDSTWLFAHECKEFWWNREFGWEDPMSLMIIGTPSAWLYLLSKGFDLFGLIDAGLAKEVGE